MKVNWLIALVLALSITACGDSKQEEADVDTTTETVIETKEEIQVNGFSSSGEIVVAEVLEEFCACGSMSPEEKNECFDAWVIKYKNAKGSSEQGEELGKGMVECDAENALNVLMKMAETENL